MNTKFFMRRLSQISYERNDIELRPGNFRSRGFKVDVFPPHAQGIISVVLMMTLSKVFMKVIR